MKIKRGIIIKKEWLDLIFEGKKTWEIRGRHTNIREVVALIESGSGEIKGYARLKNCYRLDEEKLKASYDKHQIGDLSIVKYEKVYAYEFDMVHKLNTPKPYKHPKGAIIWVNLENAAV